MPHTYLYFMYFIDHFNVHPCNISLLHLPIISLTAKTGSTSSISCLYLLLLPGLLYTSLHPHQCLYHYEPIKILLFVFFSLVGVFLYTFIHCLSAVAIYTIFILDLTFNIYILQILMSYILTLTFLTTLSLIPDLHSLYPDIRTVF